MTNEVLRQQCDALYHLQLELDSTLNETQKEEALLAEDLEELFTLQKKLEGAVEKCEGRRSRKSAPVSDRGEVGGDTTRSTVLLLLQNELEVLAVELRRETDSLSLLEKSLASQCMLNDVTYETLGTLRERIQSDHQLGCKAQARICVLQAAIDSQDRSITEIHKKFETQRRLQTAEEARMVDRDRAALRSRHEALFATQIKRNEALHASTVQRWIGELRSENAQLLAIAENLQGGSDGSEGADDNEDTERGNDWSEFGVAAGGSTRAAATGDVSLTRHLNSVRQPRLSQLRDESKRLLEDVVLSAELLENAYIAQQRHVVGSGGVGGSGGGSGSGDGGAPQ